MEKKRSKGVTIIASLYLMQAALTIFLDTRAGVNPWQSHIDLYFVIVFAFGLLFLKEWSRKGLILFAIYDISIALIRSFIKIKNFSDTGYDLISVIIGVTIIAFIFISFSGIVIYFLTRPEVKEQFSALSEKKE